MKNKYGIENPLEYYNDFFLNKQNGFSQRFIYGAQFGIILWTLLTLCVIINKLFRLNLGFKNYYLIALGIVTYAICHFSLFKEQIYLDYFEKFEKWSLMKRRVNIFLSILFIILVLVTLIVSLSI